MDSVLKAFDRLIRACVVLSPDLVWRVHLFQYNTQNTESDPRWGQFWSGTEATLTETLGSSVQQLALTGRCGLLAVQYMTSEHNFQNALT